MAAHPKQQKLIRKNPVSHVHRDLQKATLNELPKAILRNVRVGCGAPYWDVRE